MPSFSTLRRFSPFTQRFRTLSSSTSQSSSSPSPCRNPSWASGSAIVAGVASALALFYCYNSPTSPFHSVFFNNIPRGSSLPLTLPETAHGLLVRDAYRAKVFFYNEKRLPVA